MSSYTAAQQSKVRKDTLAIRSKCCGLLPNKDASEFMSATRSRSRGESDDFTATGRNAGLKQLLADLFDSTPPHIFYPIAAIAIVAAIAWAVLANRKPVQALVIR